MKKGKLYRKLYTFFFRKKAFELEKNEVYNELNAFFSANNAKIVSFEYHDLTWGVILTIEYEGKYHLIVIDRGEIIIDRKTASPSIYITGEEVDILTKFYEVITEKMFSQ